MILAFYSLLFLLHPLHVSVSEINYSEKDNALQITTRIFIDDLELSIRNQRKEPEMDLLLPKNGLTTDQLLSEYLKDHFKVKLDGKPQRMKLLGHEVEDVAIVCYIEIEKVKKTKIIEIFNDVITETFDNQSNIVHVTFQGPVKSVRLTLEKPSEEFKIQPQ
jgi:hypothetical protein